MYHLCSGIIHAVEWSVSACIIHAVECASMYHLCSGVYHYVSSMQWECASMYHPCSGVCQYVSSTQWSVSKLSPNSSTNVVATAITPDIVGHLESYDKDTKV